jgi:hypothetical protein
MTLAITAGQRDALYDQILDRLSGIGDVWIAAERKDYAMAERLGREYSDDLRLVLDDLGFGEGAGAAIELTTPPDVLRRALARLCDQAERYAAGRGQERAELHELDERDRIVMQACRQALADLGGVEGVSRQPR